MIIHFKHCASHAPTLLALATIAGTVAFAKIFVGGGAGSEGCERVELVAGEALPVMIDDTGTYVDIRATIRQTALGEGTVFVRLLDEKRPLVLAWHSVAGFQIVKPGRLPENNPAVSMASGEQTVSFRLRINFLRGQTQRVVLETQRVNGGWERVVETKMSLPQGVVSEWVEAGGVLTVGVAGPVEFMTTGVRVLREGTVLLVK